MPKHIIVMGVSGSGKSTIGQMLAQKLKVPFMDADDFHPEANRQKMANGQPLNDDDRKPWLEILTQQMALNNPAVLACSALKESYRQILDPANELNWVFLNGNKELIFERMQKRAGHFMKAEMLASQFDTLEAPSGAITVSIDQSPEQIIDEVLTKIV